MTGPVAGHCQRLTATLTGLLAGEEEDVLGAALFGAVVVDLATVAGTVAVFFAAEDVPEPELDEAFVEDDAGTAARFTGAATAGMSASAKTNVCPG